MLVPQNQQKAGYTVWLSGGGERRIPGQQETETIPQTRWKVRTVPEVTLTPTHES